MDKTTLIGASGATIILIAFILNQIGKWKNEYFIYDLFNLIGSVLLVTYAVILASYPFMVLNFVWGAVSIRDIFVDIIRNSRKKQRGFFNKWFK